MKKFIFRIANPEADCEFLNTCGLHFEYISPYANNDSGWCDMTSGQQIIGIKDAFMFEVDSEQELHLKLRCDESQLTEVK